MTKTSRQATHRVPRRVDWLGGNELGRAVRWLLGAEGHHLFQQRREMLLRLADQLADMEVVFGSESILSKEHLALAQASQTIQSYRVAA